MFEDLAAAASSAVSTIKSAVNSAQEAVNGALVGRVKGTRSGSGYLMRPGYRYRLIIRAEDLL